MQKAATNDAELLATRFVISNGKVHDSERQLDDLKTQLAKRAETDVQRERDRIISDLLAENKSLHESVRDLEGRLLRLAHTTPPSDPVGSLATRCKERAHEYDEKQSSHLERLASAWPLLSDSVGSSAA